MAHQGYGFCEFLTEEDAEYACKIMNQIKLWGKPIRVNKVSSFTLNPVVVRYPDWSRLCDILSLSRRALVNVYAYFYYYGRN